MAEFTLRVTAMMVHRASEGILDSQGTEVRVEDEGAGEYVVLRQNDGGAVGIDPEEWPLIRQAVDTLIAGIAPPVPTTPEAER